MKKLLLVLLLPFAFICSANANLQYAIDEYYKQNYDKELAQLKSWAEGKTTKEEMRYDKTRGRV